MKNIPAIIVFLLMACFASAQSDSVPRPPYQRFPKNMPLKLLLVDSVTNFTRDDLDKKKQVMIMLFSPDCEHCQHETEGIIKNIEKFSNIQIIMSTTRPFDKMKEFYQRYDLGRFANIVMGNDRSFLLPVYYNIRNLPFLAFYNKKKDLIDVFEGALPIEKVLEKFE
jgi:thiol-disulfide isomerase/thioredoxin